MEWIILAILSTVIFYVSALLFNKVADKPITNAWLLGAIAFSLALAPLAFVIAASSLITSILFYLYYFADKDPRIKDWLNKDI